MAIKYWLDGNDNWTQNPSADWSGGTVPAAGDDVTVDQGSPHVTAPITIRSLTDSSPATVYFENAGANTISTTVTNSGALDLDYYNAEGGTSLSVSTSVTNTGYIQIGNGGLTNPTSLTTAALNNTGTIELDGSSNKQASLIVNRSASFGTAGTLTGTVRLFNDTNISFASGQITTIAANASLRLDGANANITDAGSSGYNSALTSFTTVGHNAALSLENGATITTPRNVTNYGTLELDYYNGEGGASFNNNAGLTNIGTMQIGNGNLSSADTLATNMLTNKGTINVVGNTSTQASLVVNHSASFGTAGTLSGSVSMFGDSLISFASGQITAIGANAYLRLEGPTAFVADTGSTTSNSALTGLASVGKGATLRLDNGASITTARNLTNYGATNLDYFNGTGGSTLTVGRLTNIGYTQIGNGGLSSSDLLSTGSIANTGTIELDAPTASNAIPAAARASATPNSVSSSPRAVLNVGNVAGFGSVGVVTGTVRENGNTLIEFTSGQITTLATNSYLRLNGATAFISDASDTNSNSALTGLATISTGAQFLLSNNGSVAITRNLTNNGSLDLDYFYGEGGASLSVGGKFDNENYLQIGNGGQSVADRVTVGSLTNYGTINLYGNTVGTINPVGATLVVNSVAGTSTPGALTGSVYLQNDSLLQFASGQISTITGSLRINGSNAYVADAGSTTSNSALTGLSEVDGTFYVENRASVSTSGGLANYGDIRLDYFYGESGASLTVNGALDNEGYLQVGNGGQSLGDTLTAASLTNGSAATINLYGNSPGTTNPSAATLAIGSAAGTGTTGELTGSIYLQGDTLLQFASGQIQTIDSDGNLRINGSNAFVADAGSTTSNSALTGLTENDGTLYLDNSASITTSGGLSNYGDMRLDYFYGESGSSLTVNGALDNENNLQLGNGGQSLGEVITANSLINNGTISLAGNVSSSPTDVATLSVLGSVVNNGAININNDTEKLAGAVTGTGSMNLTSSSLEFGSSVAAGQTVSLNASNKLLLDAAKSFGAAISNFAVGDTIDLKSFGSSATLSFAENHANTAGTLTVTSGANTAKLAFNGSYTTASFTATTDGSGGTLIGHA